MKWQTRSSTLDVVIIGFRGRDKFLEFRGFVIRGRKEVFDPTADTTSDRDSREPALAVDTTAFAKVTDPVRMIVTSLVLPVCDTKLETGVESLKHTDLFDERRDVVSLVDVQDVEIHDTVTLLDDEAAASVMVFMEPVLEDEKS